MYRGLSYSVLALFFCAHVAFAQGPVRVRAADHDEYSRVVFDMGGRAGYKIDQSGGVLSVTFDHDMAVAEGLMESLRNVSGFKVLSQAPLKISINIPSDSRVRDFFAGERLVIDVYNSPGGARPVQEAAQIPVPAKPAPKAAPVEPAPKPQEKPVEKPVPAPEPKKEEPPPAVSDSAMPAVPVEEVQEEEAKPFKVEKRKKIAANSFNLSAMNAMGLALFEMNGELVVANDTESFMPAPEISGPQASNLGPMKAIAATGGKAFKGKMPDGFDALAEGGGLLWRVLISDELEDERTPIRPERRKIKDGAVRGASLFWPLDKPTKVLEMADPVTGVTLKVVTVDDAKQFAGAPLEFVDFKTLPSMVGLAIAPKVDDLEVILSEKGVEVTRPDGLTLSSDAMRDAAARQMEDIMRQEANKTDWMLIYNFRDWRPPGDKTVEEHKNEVMSHLEALGEGSAEAVLGLAKMYLAEGMGAESQGMFNLAASLLPGLENNPEFRALKGASEALTWRTQEAFKDLSAEDLQAYPEVDYWRAYALADLGDWQQAGEIMPRDFKALFGYPDMVFNRLALPLAEIALRAGEVENANKLLAEVDRRGKALLPGQQAALTYLKGEAARQGRKYDQTRKLWEELAKGPDDLYRTRANLALTRLQVDQKKMNREDEINHLERLRYAWRGDELEAQINYWLGRAYFQQKQYAKGLNILRDATTYAVGTDLSKRIAADMTEMYAGLFLGPDLAEVSPLDAAALYDQFSELVPVGEQGDRVVEKLAERLVDADLLDRASGLLQRQLDHRLQGMDAYRVAKRLAVIRLMNEQPAEALKSLDKADEVFKTLPEESRTPERQHETDLLRARTLAFLGRPDQALAMLYAKEHTPDVNRLRADIAWGAGYWDDAAEALEEVILDENLSLTRPFTPEQATVVLHRAVALNLASDRVALANMREKYSDSMAQTEKAKIFEVVTRPRQSISLADRETLEGIVAETDLFADFLKAYGGEKRAEKTADEPSEAAPQEAPAAAEEQAQ